MAFRVSLTLALMLMLIGSTIAGCRSGTPATDTAVPAPTPTTQPGADLANMRISWAPSTDVDLSGYYLHHGTASGIYQDKIWAGNQTSFNMAVVPSGAHYLALSAVDTSGNESPISPETQFMF